MKSLLVAVWALITFSHVSEAYPSSFRIQPSVESQFRFAGVTNISIVILDFQQTYFYDIAARPGLLEDHILIQLSNVSIQDRLENPSRKDLAAMELPFMIKINGDGECTELVTSPNETKFSLSQKENMAMMLTYNQTEIMEAFKETIATRSSIVSKDDSPFGLCNSNYTSVETDNKYLLNVRTARSDCSGKVRGGMLDNFGFSISDDSEFSYNIEIQRITGQFEKANFTIIMDVYSIPSAHVEIRQELSFVGYRKVTTNPDLSLLTQKHDVRDTVGSSEVSGNEV